MSTFHHRPRPAAALLGLAAGLLSLSLPAAHAQDGTPGTNGTTGLVLPGSFTFNDPSATFQGTNGGQGGQGGPSVGTVGFNGGTGGSGGTGVIATGTNSNITIRSGTFVGGQGGTAGLPGTGTGRIGSGNGGGGGDAFAATGAGTNITILGGTFNAGGGGSTVRGSGGNAGNDFSTTAGETASIYGGNFALIPVGGSSGTGGGAGRNGSAFALDGSNVTVYGTFLTQPGGTPIATPQTFTNSVGGFFGVLADNTGPGQTYLYSITNGGSLTLAPSPVPEASTVVSFGLLLALGLGGLLVAARRKNIAPQPPRR